jgi:putative transposase
LAEQAMAAHQVSVNRACRLLGISRSVYHYKLKLSDDDQIRQTLGELADKHRRYGFGLMFQKVRQRGHGWNHKRVYRVYCEMRLNLRRKPKKRLPCRNKVALVSPSKMNVSWSMDYMSDALMTGKKFRTVNIIDDCNREVLGIKASVSLPAKRVTEYLELIACRQGYPLQLRVDNGPENISKEMVTWARNHHVSLRYIQPGKPAQNAYIERFNRTYREEVLDMYLFKNIAEVQAITDNWLREYNYERPHQSLGNLPPKEYIKRQLVSTNPLY